MHSLEEIKKQAVFKKIKNKKSSKFQKTKQELFASTENNSLGVRIQRWQPLLVLRLRQHLSQKKENT